MISNVKIYGLPRKANIEKVSLKTHTLPKRQAPDRVLRSMILDMAIVIRKQGGKWEKTDKVIFADEAQLQKLLYESPELIPTKMEDQAAVFTREAGLPGSGFTDLVGVDAQGNILIVETKLARNGEIRRKVIGQVLEYAAYLWGMSFDELDRFFINREGKSLLELLAEKSPEIDKDLLKQSVEQNLASGKFQLIIAVDTINLTCPVGGRDYSLRLLSLSSIGKAKWKYWFPNDMVSSISPKSHRPAKRF